MYIRLTLLGVSDDIERRDSNTGTKRFDFSTNTHVVNDFLNVLLSDTYI